MLVTEVREKRLSSPLREKVTSHRGDSSGGMGAPKPEASDTARANTRSSEMIPQLN